MGAGSEVLASGLGAAITDTLFNPLEMLKVRSQLRRPDAAAETVPQAALAVYRHGGVALLWLPGLQATWLRAFSVTGLRVGLYPTVRGLLDRNGSSSSVAGKAAAGMATGALSAALANPIDTVRTRIHAQVGGPTRYASALAAALSVVNDGGVRALYRGLGATITRQALLSGAQLASYDQAKQEARVRGFSEGTELHLVCAGFSGFVAQLACMPADVVKVKVLSGDHGASVIACLRNTVREQGVTGLYRGFVPAVARQCPVILVQMPLIEAVRSFAGLGHI